MRLASLACVCLFALATASDLAGRMFESEPLWRTGAHVIVAAIAIGLIVLIASLIMREHVRMRARILWLFGLGCYALARWLRGSAGVPPDWPLIGLEVIALAMMVLSQRSTWHK